MKALAALAALAMMCESIKIPSKFADFTTRPSRPNPTTLAALAVFGVHAATPIGDCCRPPASRRLFGRHGIRIGKKGLLPGGRENRHQQARDSQRKTTKNIYCRIFRVSAEYQMMGPVSQGMRGVKARDKQTDSDDEQYYSNNALATHGKLLCEPENSKQLSALPGEISALDENRL